MEDTHRYSEDLGWSSWLGGGGGPPGGGEKVGKLGTVDDMEGANRGRRRRLRVIPAGHFGSTQKASPGHHPSNVTPPFNQIHPIRSLGTVKPRRSREGLTCATAKRSVQVDLFPRFLAGEKLVTHRISGVHIAIPGTRAAIQWRSENVFFACSFAPTSER